MTDLTKEGAKFDTGKATWTLIPFDAVASIQKILDFGAAKYAPRNWELGMAWSRPWNACLRHLDAWMRREPADPETGLSHLWHAGCCILFLIAYELRGVGTDDRPQSPPKGQGPLLLDDIIPSGSLEDPAQWDTHPGLEFIDTEETP